MNSVFKESFNDLLSKNRTFIMGCAMIAIMLFHQPFFHDNLFVTAFHLFGLWGVDIFLLVSGYGVVNSLHKNSTKQYYKNRINRIAPACLFVGLCKCILLQIECINAVAYNNHYFLIVTELALWYIYAIVVYYTIAPFVNKLLVRYKYWVVLGAGLFTLAMSYIPFGTSSIYLINRIGWIVERLPAFVLGMYIATVSIPSRFTKRLVGWGIFPLMVCAALRITRIVGHGRVIYLILLLALPMLCITASILAQWFKRIKLDRVVEYFGRTSLELYLWHEFVFLNFSTNKIFAGVHVCVKFVAAVSVSILLAHLTYILKRRIPPIFK